MISSYITYAVLFSIFFLIVLFIHGLRRIFSILKNIIDIQNDYESDRHHDFNYTVNKILNIQEVAVDAKKEVLEEISDMRKEWDMEALKTNILQQGRGNSRQWDKWQAAFGGKTKEVE